MDGRLCPCSGCYRPYDICQLLLVRILCINRPLIGAGVTLDTGSGEVNMEAVLWFGPIHAVIFNTYRDSL